MFAGFYGPDQTNVPDMRAMTIASMIMSTRMIEEIREKEQLVYSIGAGFRPGTTYPGFGTMSAHVHDGSDQRPIDCSRRSIRCTRPWLPKR